jgi:hypothetical protein
VENQELLESKDNKIKEIEEKLISSEIKLKEV